MKKFITTNIDTSFCIVKHENYYKVSCLEIFDYFTQQLFIKKLLCQAQCHILEDSKCGNKSKGKIAKET